MKKTTTKKLATQKKKNINKSINQTKTNLTKANEIKKNETKNNETKTNEIKTKEIKKNETKNNKTKTNNGEYIKECYFEGKEIIFFDEIQRYYTKANSIYEILNIEKKKLGTGFICEIQLKDKKIIVLLTNNHILDENKIKIGKIIKIRNNNGIIKEIKITKDRFKCTNKLLDYTCIEIIEKDLLENYLKIDPEINCENPYDEYKYDKFIIIQYPRNEKIGFVMEKLKKLKMSI